MGEKEPTEPFTDDIGKLYRVLCGEYGKATKVYLDIQSRGTIQTGWCFTKRMRYEDARGNNPEKDYYTREVWVTFFEKCGLDDPLHVTSTHRDGSVTHHPFKNCDIGAWRKRKS